MLILANILLVAGALTGMYCISQYDKRGFIIFLVVEFSMAYIGMATCNYGLVIAAALYLCMNVYSYLQWSKKK